jgi:hypothetical protein
MSMNKIVRLIFLPVGLICLTAYAFAQGTPSDVHVKLVLADNKTAFRIGDQIKFFLEFTADRDGYQADTVPDGSQPTSDELQVSPDAAVYHWLAEIRGNGAWGRDVVSYQRLSTTPTRVELVLNDSLRIDQPGKYSARVTTRRVFANRSRGESAPPIVLTTNDVTFDVEEMTEADEAREVQRISDQLDATRDMRTRQAISQQLTFLSGAASSREKVRRFLDNSGNIYYGLFIARNRALVLQLLEAAMRDPNTPAESSLLGVLTSLRLLQQNLGSGRTVVVTSAFDPTPDPRVLEIRDSYVRELAAGLAKRTGKSQSVTAMTVLTNLPKDPKAAAPLLSESRRILLEQFESLSIFGQDTLLQRNWDMLRDPSLIPALKKILGGTDIMGRGIAGVALKRLIELSPDEARPFVIAEIGDSQSIVDPEILAGLPDKTLPEVDAVLLNQLRALIRSGGIREDFLLKRKLALVVRYATSRIYPDLMTTYTDNVSRLSFSSRAALLAFLAKQNERESLPLIEQALSDVPPGQVFNFLPELTRLYFSDGIAAILRTQLESDVPEIASNSAYLISKYGSESDEKVLEARLERWRKDWDSRVAEADASLQGRIEVELISGLTRGKSWKLSAEKVKELQRSCVTEICKRNFPVQ